MVFGFVIYGEAPVMNLVSVFYNSEGNDQHKKKRLMNVISRVQAELSFQQSCFASENIDKSRIDRMAEA